MPNYNKVLLMGNLTRDVELKSIAGGQTVAQFGLAINRHYTTQSGEKREEVTFVDCEAWARTGETIAKFLSKGKPIFVEGRLKLDQWEKEGQKHSKIRVVVESFQFVDSKGSSGGGGSHEDHSGGSARSESGWSKPAGKPAAAPAGAPAGEPPADDIPF